MLLFFLCVNVTEPLQLSAHFEMFYASKVQADKIQVPRKTLHREHSVHDSLEQTRTYVLLCDLYGGEGLDLLFVRWRRSSVFKLIQ